MADKSVRVELRGVKELNRAFKQVDLNLPKELRKEFKVIAILIRNRAAAKAPGRVGTVLKVRAGQSGAGIGFPAGGTWRRGAHDPTDFYPWMDFGGSVGRGHRVGDYWSGAIKRKWMGVPVGSGRYLYPTIAESSDDIGRLAGEAIERTARRADLDVRG